MADRKNAWTSISAPTLTAASLATSSTLVAGRESNAVDNSTTKYLDAQVRYKVTAGSSPAAGTIELWAIPSIDGTNYPDVFDGTDSAETATTRDILYGSGKLIASTPTDATSSRAYELICTSMRDVFGTLPQKWVFFLVHSTGVNLDATGGNHVMHLYGNYENIA